MPTEIVFSGGHSITIAFDLEGHREVLDRYDVTGLALFEYELEGERDSAGNPIKVHVNVSQIAYLREPRPERSRVPFSH